MNNFVAEGKTIKYANTGSAISSGDVVVLGAGIGVAVTDIAATTGVGSVLVEGVVEIAKVSGTAFTQGAKLYWDSGNSELTTTAQGNLAVGVAYEAAASADTTAKVKLVYTAVGQAANQADSVAADVATLVTDFNALLAKLQAAGLMADS